MTLFTLADARRHRACANGYARFKNALRKAHPEVADLDTIQWSIGDVARVNLDDALWCLCMVDDPRQRVAAIMPAVRRASKQTEDSRVHDCITQVNRWLTGEDVDLAAAGAGAGAAEAAGAAHAARAAADAARAAARAAAYAAAYATADAARAAAYATADAAADAANAARAAAAWAADAAAADAAAADAANAREQERAQQVADLILAFPPTFGGAA